MYILNNMIEIKELHERQRNMSELAANLKLRLDSYRLRCVTSSTITRAIGSHRNSPSRSGSSVAAVAHSRNTNGPSDLSVDVVDGTQFIHESSPALSMRATSEVQINRLSHSSSVNANSPVARLRRTPQRIVQVSNKEPFILVSNLIVH